jgi:hypothetical protein
VLAATAMRLEHVDTRVIPVGSHYLVYEAQLKLWQPATLATTRQGAFRWTTRYAAFKALRKVIGKKLNEEALF